MGRVVTVVWLALLVALLALLGQRVGLYDVPVLRDLPVLMPIGTPAPGLTEPSPIPPSATVVAKRPTGPSPVPATKPECTVAAPHFVQGIAALKATLGATMGEPLECERVTDGAGNTEQRTTTGLAYYRARGNPVAFTNGYDHWALGPAGVVHWIGEDLEPPDGAEPGD